LSKDRGSFTSGEDSKNLIDLVINASNKMEAKIATAGDASSVSSKAGSSDFVTNTWTYVVYSFAMTGGDTTSITLYKDTTTVDGTESFSGCILVDSTSYNMYVGIERKTTSTDWQSHFNGYIYDLNIYQTTWDTASVTTHMNGGCKNASTCLTWDFNKYEGVGNAETTCDSTSCDDRSCVKADTC
jgi:hypothetical protein